MYSTLRSPTEQTTWQRHALCCSDAGTSPPPPSGDGASGGGESLESLRALAAKAWNLKQQKSNTSAAGNDDNGEDETNVAVAMAGIPVVEDDSSSMELPETADEDRKPAAVPTTAATRKVVPPALGPTMVPSETISPSNTWQERSKGIPRCGPATGIYDTSVFKGSHKATMSSSTRTCLKRLFSEFEDLQKSLPSDKLCSAWLRFDEERPQFIRAILTAPLPGPSPYAGGVFAFDIMIPNSYPNVSPKVQIITTGRGKIRFGPNLYASGKVCLSLLGTWSGPKWNPKKSSLFQVLVSIQSLLLGVEHPYFLEPGHGGWEEKVKEGDFASVGNTLSGKVVREDSRLPAHVWAYEDIIRVASLRYAILEPLTVVASQGKISDAPNSNLAHLLPFREVLHLHFSQNANDIAESVAEWINASRPTFIKSRNGRASMNPHHENLLNNMKNAMMPQNKSREEPKTPYPAKFVNDLKKWNGQVEGYLKTVCEMQPPAAISMDETGPNTIRVEAMKPPPSSASTKNDVSSAEETDLLRQKMKDAVESKNYILAGQIQTEIQELESFQQKVTDMEAKMSEAVSKKDYVTAGKLQAELKMLHNTKQKQNFPMQQPSIEEMHNSPMEQMMASLSQPWDDGFEDDDMSFGEDDDDDDDSFAPPPPHTNRRAKRKEWGTGHVLNEAVATPTSSTQVAAAPAKIAVSRLPLVDVRRLRIRLPNSSVLEEFDGAEKLSTVYQVVQQHLALAKVDIDRQPVQPKLFQSIGYTDDQGSQKVGALGGAFAAPLSEFGFTLLSTHPKREYSLEMDGMKSLDELNVAKSAALTVMKCNERGMAKRADLEDKLAAAKGDAMDVDDLNYEALQELGEKIGIVAPGDGTRKMLDESALERVSALLSPKEFLCRKTTGDNDDSRCCICLGDFDPNDSNPSLRLLNHCGHVMHSSCLQTWLTTTTSCPVCKHSLSV